MTDHEKPKERAEATLPELPRGPRRGDEVDIVIERVGEGGHGEADREVLIGPQKAYRKYTYVVRKAVPGDRVRCVVEAMRRRRLTCRIVEILEPSPDRIPARCPHFGQREQSGKGCGGCTQQATAYPRQLLEKRRRIQGLMAQHGIAAEAVAAPIAMDTPWYYRNKMELNWGDDRDRNLALGMYPSGWRKEVVNLTECHLMHPGLAKVAGQVRAWAAGHGLVQFNPPKSTGFLRNLTLRDGKRTGDVLVELITSVEETPLWEGEPTAALTIARHFKAFVVQILADMGCQDPTVYWTVHRAVRGQPTRFDSVLLSGSPTFSERLNLPGGAQLTFAIHPRAFFQPNPIMAETLIAQVAERLGAARTVFDLYCGTGTLGLSLAPSVDTVVGVEIVSDAVDAARDNAKANGIDNAKFFGGDVGEVLASAQLAPYRETCDAVVLDPPRSGLMPKAFEHLAALAPPRIIYVSCNPATLARDLQRLIASGYRLEGDIQPVDLFPHTHHVENIATLIRGHEPTPQEASHEH